MFAAALIFFVAVATSGAEQEKTVAVFPFQINAAEDLGYLREGILDMLASRLAWEGKVKIIEKQRVKDGLSAHQGKVDETIAREVGGSLGADYVLFVTVVATNRVLNIQSGNPVSINRWR